MVIREIPHVLTISASRGSFGVERPGIGRQYWMGLPVPTQTMLGYWRFLIQHICPGVVQSVFSIGYLAYLCDVAGAVANGAWPPVRLRMRQLRRWRRRRRR